jgi:hypothetical protein
MSMNAMIIVPDVMFFTLETEFPLDPFLFYLNFLCNFKVITSCHVPRPLKNPITIHYWLFIYLPDCSPKLLVPR